MTKKVCCVVPIYNVREFLPDCLDSLAAQTLPQEDLQVVLIDDGSTDGSSQIADEYAACYKNFEVHHIENGGLGHARNVGARYADAEWLCFADSDDVIEPFAYEEMCALGEKNGTDIVVGDVVRFDSRRRFVSHTQRRAFADADELMHISTHPALINDTTAWNKLFRKSFYDANELFWVEGVKYEDIPVTIPAHYLANGVSYLNKVVYRWRSRDNAASSITQQRISDPSNFADRLTVMGMVDAFFERQSLDDEQCLVKDVHWLSVDLSLYVNDCLNADEAYRARVMGAVRERLRTIDQRAFERIDAIDRLKYRAIELGDEQKLLEVLRFRRRGMKTLRVSRDARTGRWHGNFPFAWADAALTDMTDELERTGVRQKIRTVRLDEEGGLTVLGEAFAPYVGEFSSSRLALSACLVDVERREVAPVELHPRHTAKPARVDLSRDYRRVVVRWHRHAGYECRVSASQLAELPCGTYKVRLSYEVGPLACAPRPLASPVRGAGPRPWALFCDGRKYAVSYDPNYDLVLTVAPAGCVVTGASLVAGCVRLETSEGAAEVDVRSLRLGAVRSMPLDYPLDVPCYLEAGEDEVVSLSAEKDGALALRLLPAAPVAELLELAEGHLLHARLAFAGVLAGACIDAVELVGRSFGAIVGLGVSTAHAGDVAEATLDLADAHATELMRADVYDLFAWVTDASGKCHRRKVLLGCSGRELVGRGCAFNDYAYELEVGWGGTAVAVRVRYQERWYESSKRRRRFSAALLYPLFRLLPLRRKTVVLESYWATKTDCNPYALYRWLDEHHPEYDCVIPVVDLRMPIEGGGRKVRYGSLAYRYELARSRYFVNNVNFPLWHRKRAGQVEIQTMHGTPLKTLGVDVKSDFPTQRSLEDFLYKCQRWDYLVVQGEACEDITRSCYRYNGPYLETGYPRNDELFARNTPESVAAIKCELGLDPARKLVLYAPTWRIKNRFDLKLDLARMCDELGDEYQIALRVHHLAAAGIDRAALDERVVDLTFAKSISELYLVTDVLITDYSSVMFDYATLRRPMLFYPYDLEDYRDNLRGFNIDLEREAPGPLLFDTESVIDAVRHLDRTVEQSRERYDAFVSRYIEFERGIASEQIFGQVFRRG